ncbi:MAG: DUF89 family protein [Pirellulales bacterium]|nr:DUF89 family protein [Pirellulales bacterium]
MRTYLDCIPCIIRQSLDSVRFMTSDESVQERVLREVLKATAEIDLKQSPPEMAQWIHRRIRFHVAQADPYREVKDQFNQMALELFPAMKAWVEESGNPMETAVRLAIAGNVIDFGVNSRLTTDQVTASVKHSLSDALEGDIDHFDAAVSSAERILYLTDNAGEIVFDRLLIEQLPRGHVTVAVRSYPIINDATMLDAATAGITEWAPVIGNGSDAPGTILSDCSEEFLDHFEHSDLIISKGQGNYETLCDVERSIYFLLKVKCAVIARDIGCAMGSLVLRHHQGTFQE